MKIDLLKFWPVIALILPAAAMAIWFAAHIDASILYMQDSMDAKFAAMQDQMDALSEKIDMRQSYDEKELEELKESK